MRVQTWSGFLSLYLTCSFCSQTSSRTRHHIDPPCPWAPLAPAASRTFLVFYYLTVWDVLVKDSLNSPYVFLMIRLGWWVWGEMPPSWSAVYITSRLHASLRLFSVDFVFAELAEEVRVRFPRLLPFNMVPFAGRWRGEATRHSLYSRDWGVVLCPRWVECLPNDC